MTTAQILYEQYKVLPPRIQRELKDLINRDVEEEKVPLRDQIKEGLKEIKLIKQGKLKAKSAEEFLAELRKEIKNDD